MLLRVKRKRIHGPMFKVSTTSETVTAINNFEQVLRSWVTTLNPEWNNNDVEEAIRRSLLDANPEPRHHVNEEASQNEATFAMPVEGAIPLMRTFKVIGNESSCLLNRQGSAGEINVRNIVYSLLGDKYKYLINYRGDPDITNPKTNRRLEADIAIIDKEEIVCVIEVNGDQHWCGAVGHFVSEETKNRDSYKYAKWMSMGIDVITVPYYNATGDSCHLYLKERLTRYI